MKDYQILLYYKYVPIENPKVLMDSQRKLCEELNLKGRIIIAEEGINGTLEGTFDATEKYIREMNKDKRFGDINWKKSSGTGRAFKKLSIKVRDEIVTTGVKNKDFGPLAKRTGKYLTAEELYKWYQEGREFYIVDMRNDYEYEVGRFKNSLRPEGMRYFRDAVHAVKKLEHLKDKTIVTVCTGGVRCETASGLLMKYGFNNVYQLQHGIVTFIEKYPNTFFDGKLYVFDGREIMGFNTDSPDHKVIGRCRMCGEGSENLVNYYEDGVNRYGIICIPCCKSGKVRLERDYEERFRKPVM